MKRRHRQSHGPTGRPALPGGGASEGGSIFPPKMRLHDRQRGAERLVGFTTNYNTPHQHYMGGTTYALQCSAVQFPSHPMTGHVVATCDLPQPAAPTPHGWTSRRVPAGRSRLAAQEQRDGGSQRPRRREPRGSRGRVPDRLRGGCGRDGGHGGV